jgi:hypothetical protein
MLYVFKSNVLNRGIFCGNSLIYKVFIRMPEWARHGRFGNRQNAILDRTA